MTDIMLKTIPNRYSVPLIGVCFVLMLVAMLMISGCGSGHPDRFAVEKIGDSGYTRVEIPWHGRQLECVQAHFVPGSNRHATWGGLSCDFFAFHRDELVKLLRTETSP